MHAPDLTDEQRRHVRAVIATVVPGAKVKVFGSRATGRSRPFSDLDLLFLAPSRLDLLQRARLLDAFEAGPLPIRVDMVDGEDLPPGMAERVLAEAVPL